MESRVAIVQKCQVRHIEAPIGRNCTCMRVILSYLESNIPAPYPCLSLNVYSKAKVGEL